MKLESSFSVIALFIYEFYVKFSIVLLLTIRQVVLTFVFIGRIRNIANLTTRVNALIYCSYKQGFLKGTQEGFKASNLDDHSPVLILSSLGGPAKEFQHSRSKYRTLCI